MLKQFYEKHIKKEKAYPIFPIYSNLSSDLKIQNQQTAFREPKITYENNAFDGGKAKKEKAYKLYKSSDMFY